MIILKSSFRRCLAGRYLCITREIKKSGKITHETKLLYNKMKLGPDAGKQQAAATSLLKSLHGKVSAPLMLGFGAL